MERKPLGIIGASFVVIAVGLVLVCFGVFFLRPSTESRALKTVQQSGITIATTTNGPVQSGGHLVTTHKVFTTTEGRSGHLIIVGRAFEGVTDAAGVARLYVTGGVDTNYMSWNYDGDAKTLIILVNKGDWPEAQRTALDRAVRAFK